MKGTLKIELPMFRDRLHVFFGTLEECKEAMRQDGESEYKVEDWAINTEEFIKGMYSQNDGYRLIWLPKIPQSIDDYGCLAHEIEHAVFNILHAKGIIHTGESDEVYAYLTGFLFSEIDVCISTEREEIEKTNQNNE